MHDRSRLAAVWRVVLVLALPALASALFLAGCGGSGVPSEARTLVDKAQRAGDEITSYHKELVIFFESPGMTAAKTEELIVDVNGGDVSVKDTFFDQETDEGTVVQETTRVGEKQWTKDPAGGGWVEEEPTLDEEAIASYTPRVSDFLSNSSSVEDLGEESVNGTAAFHLRFELSPEDVTALLPNIPPSNLEASTGGQVDLWIDADTDYPMKYEIVYRNVTVGEGYSDLDVRIVIDVTNIGQSIEITPPV
jgi:hypothetical protein